MRQQAHMAFASWLVAKAPTVFGTIVPAATNQKIILL